jgi:hypothetical protein
MSLTLAITINVLLCLSLLAALARAMSLVTSLTPHVPAEGSNSAGVSGADAFVLCAAPSADAEQPAEVAAAA